MKLPTDITSKLRDNHHAKVCNGKIWLRFFVSNLWGPEHSIFVFVEFCLVFFKEFGEDVRFKVFVEDFLDCV